MNFSYNTSGVPERKGGVFTLVDEDTYHVIVDKVDATFNKDGVPQAVITYRIIVGEQSGSKFEKKTLREWKTFVPDEEQKGWNKHFLKVLGQPWDGAVMIETDDWIGHQLLAVVKHKEYKGKIYANIVAHDTLPEEAQVPAAPPSGTTKPDEGGW